MRAQAASTDPKRRKEAFDRVQEIVVEQEPFIFLINKNSLSAVSPAVHGAAPVILSPQTFWNADRLTVSAK
jgi:ABC-type transport system substrate-binding protein